MQNESLIYRDQPQNCQTVAEQQRCSRCLRWRLHQAAFSFNLVDILKTQGDHIAKCIAACNDKQHGVVMDVTEESEEWWVQQVIANRGKSNYARDCTPGYYNFEGTEQRHQDGNFNGGVIAYYNHVSLIRHAMRACIMMHRDARCIVHSAAVAVGTLGDSTVVLPHFERRLHRRPPFRNSCPDFFISSPRISLSTIAQVNEVGDQLNEHFEFF